MSDADKKAINLRILTAKLGDLVPRDVLLEALEYGSFDLEGTSRYLVSCKRISIQQYRDIFSEV